MRHTLKESICRSRRLPNDTAVIMGRAELLSNYEKELIEAIFVRDLSPQSLASMLGVTEVTVRRRVHKICRRLSSRRFLDAARALPYLSKDDAVLARLRFCQGLTQRELYQRLGISYHILRRRLDKLGTQIKIIRRMISRGGAEIYSEWDATAAASAAT